MLLMNDRRKYADIFWFALFHEIKHILQQMKKEVYISTDGPRKHLTLGLNDEKSEREADLFSSAYLIPNEQYERFVLAKDYTISAVKKFADAIAIHPSIVVGRLQHDNHIAWNSSLVDLKIKYAIS
jgi:Zn-dependent peptidase ImmA (M78 family)